MKRENIALTTLALGVLLVLGAVGSLECDEISIAECLIRGAIGCFMVWLSVYIGGDKK